MTEKIKVLFLCTGNTCRSQMAEGWTRHLHGDWIEPYSGGLEKLTVNPLATKVMAEVGIDITDQEAKHHIELAGTPFDYVITVCENAKKRCPGFPRRTKLILAGFDDPPRLAIGAKTEADALPHYRRVRDDIRHFIEQLPEILKGDRHR